MFVCNIVCVLFVIFIWMNYRCSGTGCVIGNIIINHLMYADDLVITINIIIIIVTFFVSVCLLTFVLCAMGHCVLNKVNNKALCTPGSLKEEGPGSATGRPSQ